MGDADTYQVNVNQPQPFHIRDNNNNENWKMFKQKWRNYAIITNVKDRENSYQVALFLNCLADSALKVYNSFTFITNETERTVDEIIEKFDAYAVGEVNETYERYVFNNRTQKQETIDSFVSDLKLLVKSCNFCIDCVDSLIRDRIILGISDENTKAALLKKRNLTLADCIDTCKANESTKKCMQNMSNVHDDVHGISKKKYTTNKHYSKPKFAEQYTGMCNYCGNKHIYDKRVQYMVKHAHIVRR